MPVVAASGLLSCELIMTSASEWLQGCCADLLMYCTEMLESWEEQNASCDESAQGVPPKKQQQKNIVSMESGTNHKLEENSRMTGKMTKLL